MVTVKSSALRCVELRIAVTTLATPTLSDAGLQPQVDAVEFVLAGSSSCPRSGSGSVFDGDEDRVVAIDRLAAARATLARPARPARPTTCSQVSFTLTILADRRRRSRAG